MRNEQLNMRQGHVLLCCCMLARCAPLCGGVQQGLWQPVEHLCLQPVPASCLAEHCFITQQLRICSVLYLAYKYADSFEDAVVANTNVGAWHACCTPALGLPYIQFSHCTSTQLQALLSNRSCHSYPAVTPLLLRCHQHVQTCTVADLAAAVQVGRTATEGVPWEPSWALLPAWRCGGFMPSQC